MMIVLVVVLMTVAGLHLRRVCEVRRELLEAVDGRHIRKSTKE